MRFTFALLGALLLIGCSGNDTTSPLAPFSPEIVNDPDAFQFQVTDAAAVTTTVSYTWQNSGARASVDHSSAITSGTATVTLLDADGTEVYSSALMPSGNEMSSDGTPGQWAVRVTLSGTSGTLNFRAEAG